MDLGPEEVLHDATKRQAPSMFSRQQPGDTFLRQNQGNQTL